MPSMFSGVAVDRSQQFGGREVGGIKFLVGAGIQREFCNPKTAGSCREMSWHSASTRASSFQ